jgi:uncharacterized membrane protein (DUF4010 family)
MVQDIFLKIIFSLGIGALVGIEREQKGKGVLAQGVRTFMLASFFGTLSSYFSAQLQSFLLFYLAFLILGVLTALGYLNKTRKTRNLGMTTEVAFLITFLLGVLVFFDSFPFYLSISGAILLTFVLASIDLLHGFSKHLTSEEIWNAAFFAILSFIILPILPNEPMGPFNAINPFMIWASVVTVLSVSFAAYILMRIFGPKRGVILTGLFGGLVSSTGVAVSMANDVKKNERMLYSGTFAMLVASSTMFLRMLFISSIFNYQIALMLLIPLAILGILGYILSISFFEKILKERPKLALKSPLDLKTALKFGIFFTSILFLSNLAKHYFGESAIYLVALLAGLIEVDAVTISFSSLALTSISPAVAVKGIILAGLSNTFSKWVLTVWLGTKPMAIEVGKVFLILIAAGGILLFLV